MKTSIAMLAVALACAGCETTGLKMPDLGANLTALAKAGSSMGVGSGKQDVVAIAMQSGQKLKDATTDITEEQEIVLGQGIASNLLGAAPLLQNRNVQRYVNQVGRWLASQTERPDLPWQFAVLDDAGINAFAAPGGYIFITRGMLARMNNEAELAGVLAHEIAHVLKKHHLQAIKKSAGMSLFADIGSYAVASKTGVNSAIASNLAGAFKDVYARGLDKGDEFEADRMGVVIAARAGYDPYGLPAVLQMMQAFSAQDSGFALMFKTHPPLADRLVLFEKLMAASFERFEQQPTLAPRFMTSSGNDRKK